MNDIVMPKLSDTMTEGRLVSWKKQVGEAVQRGDILAEVETDKANMELEAFTSGVILEIRVQAGETAQVGSVIAVIGTAEEKGAPSAKPEAAPQTPPPAASAQPGPPAGAVKSQLAAAKAKPAEVAPGEQPAAAPSDSGEMRQVPPGETAEQGSGAGAQTASEAAAAENQAPAEADMPTASQAVAPTGTPAPAGAPPVSAPQRAASASVGAQALGAGAAPVAGSGAHVERAAPVVRRRARELGIDLGQVKGSGPEGRILLQDLERRSAPQTAQGAPGGERPATETALPLSRLRSAIARTVAEAWRTIPHFSVTVEVVMDEAEAVRRQLKGCGVEVTVNDMIVKGASLALRKFPLLNASFADGSLTLHDRVNIGVAVGVPDGVLVPVITDCQRLTLQEIASGCRKMVGRARSGGSSEQEMSGGTFSVSNLGMYGVQQFNAIIYPSQAAVLAVGAVSDAVLPRGGVPVCVRLMKLTLSADHRVVDGAYAAQFLAELKEMLENPVRLLL